MRRMSISKLQSLSSWRQRHHEQPLGIPGHNRPSLPQRRWNWIPGRCLSRNCSSSKLQPVPGQRESDMEVDQGWHLWDLMKYKGDTTLTFRLRVSKEQIPLDSEMHFQPISCQYPSRKHTTSYHTEWVQVKKKFTHFTHSQQDLEPGHAKDEHEQTTKPSKKLATKTPWAANWNPGTQQACAPSSPGPKSTDCNMTCQRRPGARSTQQNTWTLFKTWSMANWSRNSLTKKPWKPPTPSTCLGNICWYGILDHLASAVTSKFVLVQWSKKTLINSAIFSMWKYTECARKKWSHTVKYLT